MEKRISKRKEQERKELLLKTKKRRLILTLSSLPPFILTVVFIVLYALRIHFAWLTGLTSLLWLLLKANVVNHPLIKRTVVFKFKRAK